MSGRTLDAEAFARLPASARRVPLLLLVGEERFFREQALAALLQALPGAERVELEGGAERPGGGAEAGGGAAVLGVLDELRTPSLFGRPKVVRVREADGWAAAAGERLAELIGKGRFAGTLVLELRRAPDARSRAGKALRAAGLVVGCEPLYATPPPWKRGAAPWDTPLHAWVRARAAAHGKHMRPEVAHSLIEAAGTDLYEIAATIDKLVLLLGARERIEDADVAAVVGHTRRDGVFALVEAIAHGRAARALELLDRAFEVGLVLKDRVVGEPAAIGTIAVGMLYRELEAVRRARAWLEAEGRTPGPATASREREAAAALGLSPLAARRALAAAAVLDERALERRYRALLECDRGVKGRAGARLALEALLASWSEGAGGDTLRFSSARGCDRL